MIEPLLCGIVLGLIPVTLMGLFVAAWNQYRRGGSAVSYTHLTLPTNREV